MGVEPIGEVERVRAAAGATGLLDGGRVLVAMLSGGRDSVCLLDVAVALRGAGAVHALHVNYGLREAADADERHCASLCAELGVELSVVRAGRAPGKEQGNLQTWARELRYDAAGRLARELDAERGDVDAQAGGAGTGASAGQDTPIATGHTASDQVETILYRLAASPGRRALLGMAAAEGRLVRPLLAITREQTAAYCEERGLGWCEDASNLDESFARARVRKRLVPALREIHPAAESNVLRTARLLGQEAELLDELIERELARGDGTSIELARLDRLPPALARLVVIGLAERTVGAYVPQAGERVAELLALGACGGRRELHLGRFAAAVIDDGVLSMRRLAPGESSERLRTPPDGD